MSCPTQQSISSSATTPNYIPQRLSALYQYHNAPEVTPGHGLEYDDNIYPSSDKYPVVQSTYASPYTSKRASDPSNRPPRIIFGMKVQTFLVVAAVFILIIVGASVGGAVGGKSMRDDQAQGTINPSSTTTTSSTSTAMPAAATPSYAPFNDCPSSNATTYTSTYNSKQTFTKYCDYDSPLSLGDSTTDILTKAFVYTFDDCIQVCAAYNFYAAGTGASNCTVAVYEAATVRPGNYWVGSAQIDEGVGLLHIKPGTSVALLDS